MKIQNKQLNIYFLSYDNKLNEIYFLKQFEDEKKLNYINLKILLKKKTFLLFFKKKSIFYIYNKKVDDYIDNSDMLQSFCYRDKINFILVKNFIVNYDFFQYKKFFNAIFSNRDIKFYYFNKLHNDLNDFGDNNNYLLSSNKEYLSKDDLKNFFFSNFPLEKNKKFYFLLSILSIIIIRQNESFYNCLNIFSILKKIRKINNNINNNTKDFILAKIIFSIIKNFHLEDIKNISIDLLRRKILFI